MYSVYSGAAAQQLVVMPPLASLLGWICVAACGLCKLPQLATTASTWQAEGLSVASILLQLFWSVKEFSIKYYRSNISILSQRYKVLQFAQRSASYEKTFVNHSVINICSHGIQTGFFIYSSYPVLAYLEYPLIIAQNLALLILLGFVNR